MDNRKIVYKVTFIKNLLIFEKKEVILKKINKNGYGGLL